MPLYIAPAPAPALRSVLAALRSPTAVRDARSPLAVRTAQSSLRPELPLPIHEMAHIGAPAATSPTRLTGWRFLLREADAAAGSASVGAAEAVLTADGWAFAHFRGGPYVMSTERALQQAGSLTAGYQPRLLSVPQLYMLTLWLHGDTDADASEGAPRASDLLIPLAPAPPGIAAHQSHRVDALLPLLTRRLVTPAPLLRTPV